MRRHWARLRLDIPAGYGSQKSGAGSQKGSAATRGPGGHAADVLRNEQNSRWDTNNGITEDSVCGAPNTGFVSDLERVARG